MFQQSLCVLAMLALAAPNPALAKSKKSRLEANFAALEIDVESCAASFRLREAMKKLTDAAETSELPEYTALEESKLVLCHSKSKLHFEIITAVMRLDYRKSLRGTEAIRKWHNAYTVIIDRMTYHPSEALAITDDLKTLDATLVAELTY